MNLRFRIQYSKTNTLQNDFLIKFRSDMNFNLKQAAFTIPVFCKDQAADIRDIETTANKALQNIHSLYNEIMTPKPNLDTDWEASANDYSSDSTSFSTGIKSSCPSYYCVPKLLPKKLCSKCQKLISLCSTCHKQSSNSILHSQHHARITNKNFLQERSYTFPQVKPSHKSSCHPEQKDFYQQEQHAQKHISQEKRISGREFRRNSCQGFSQSNPVLKEQNSEKDFWLQESKKSHFPETISVTNPEFGESPNYTFKSAKESNMQFKITVPKPFSLTAKNVKRQQTKEEKILKLREEINSQTERELNVKFSSKPVPKHVRLPLYDEMVKMNEQRKKERKEKCIEIMNKKIKPFNLNTSIQTCVSKSKSMSNLSLDGSKTFKARPVPKNILSENISKKVKNKEEIRKFLIAQRAEELLKMSSLPFSPKTVHRSHSLYNISYSTSKSNINVTKEKIEAITNRLYSIKCQETVKNQDNNFLQNDLWHVEISHPKKNCPKKSNDDRNKDKKFYKSALPYNNFPVRMTTTTLLREKQIRTDIEMRKRRKEMDESIKEKNAQKKKEILKNVWAKLKSAEHVYDIEKEIEDKIKSYRESQKDRDQEYEKELQDMMKRVSKQCLLIERQSKELKEKIVDSTRSANEMSEKEASSCESENDDLESPPDASTSSASGKSDSV